MEVYFLLEKKKTNHEVRLNSYSMLSHFQQNGGVKGMTGNLFEIYLKMTMVTLRPCLVRAQFRNINPQKQYVKAYTLLESN